MRVECSRFTSGLVLGLVVLVLPGLTAAGSISLAWDPVSGATGYRAYYGTSAGQYTGVQDMGSATAGTLAVPNNCTNYYVALKAYNGQGALSGSYSNEVAGWGHPAVTTISPAVLVQGDQRTLNIDGANFGSGAAVDFTIANLPRNLQNEDLLTLQNVQVISCTRIQALVTVEPRSKGRRAMKLGTYSMDVDVVNTDGVTGGGAKDVEVRFGERRSDINTSDLETTNRVDGKDLAWLAHAFNTDEASSMWSADSDLDGDGSVDGNDLAMLASRFGMCWNGTAWSNGACN
jgi:hypothetical protein